MFSLLIYLCNLKQGAYIGRKKLNICTNLWKSYICLWGSSVTNWKRLQTCWGLTAPGTWSENTIFDWSPFTLLRSHFFKLSATSGSLLLSRMWQCCVVNENQADCCPDTNQLLFFFFSPQSHLVIHIFDMNVLCCPLFS